LDKVELLNYGPLLDSASGALERHQLDTVVPRQFNPVYEDSEQRQNSQYFKAERQL